MTPHLRASGRPTAARHPLTRPRGATCRRSPYLRPLRPCRAAGCCAPGAWPPSSRRALRLPRQRLPRCGAPSLALQSLPGRARARARGSRVPAASAARICRAPLRSGFCARRWTRKFHAGSTRLREADSDGLFGRPRSMLPVANVFDLLVDELARLCARCLSCAFRAASTFTCLLLRHDFNPLLVSG